jgi:LemA protein
MLILILIIALVVIVLGWAVLAYNSLVTKRNRNQEAWSQITVELKRRYDLIPNLVTTVKGYATHESSTFEAVTQARANAVDATQAGDPARIAASENVLTSTLKSLFAVAENYPALRAVESFLQLQEQLTATEDKLEYARRYYNTSARDYNIALQTFPRNLIAHSFSFRAVAFFETDAASQAVPQVNFSATPPPPAPPSSPSTPPVT